MPELVYRGGLLMRYYLQKEGWLLTSNRVGYIVSNAR
jgi:hypothetical protein